MNIIVQSIIPDVNQEDVQYTAPLYLTYALLSAPDQLSRRRRMPSMKRPLGRKTSNGKNLHGRLKSVKPSKCARKERERSRSQKGSRKARVLREPSLPDRLKPRLLEVIDLIPKPDQKLDHAVADNFLFAMMSTKSKPTWMSWKHSTCNGADYMISTVVEPQKKLPVFKPGKWSIAPRSRTALYGHDAKSMKNFTLHFDYADQV